VTVMVGTRTRRVVGRATGLTVTQYRAQLESGAATWSWFVEACNPYGCVSSATWRFHILP
jgi:hypothetical protein